MNRMMDFPLPSEYAVRIRRPAPICTSWGQCCRHRQCGNAFITLQIELLMPVLIRCFTDRQDRAARFGDVSRCSYCAHLIRVSSGWRSRTSHSPCRANSPKLAFGLCVGLGCCGFGSIGLNAAVTVRFGHMGGPGRRVRGVWMAC